jgi:hypothetical protein
VNASLAKAILAERSAGARILYGVATGDNTVEIAGSTVAVTLPALDPVVSGDYVAVLASGADRLILGAVRATAWTAVTFAGAWANFGSPWQPAQYRRVGDMTHLRGLVKITSGSVAVATPSDVFSLPAGLRPPSDLVLGSKAMTSTGVVQTVDVRVAPAGNVYYYTDGGATLTTTGWLALDGLSFSVTA